MILQAPGVAQDSFGQLHVRGDHANVQYRINGIHPRGHRRLRPGPRYALRRERGPADRSAAGAVRLRTAGIVDIQTKAGALDKGGRVECTAEARHLQPASSSAAASGRFSYYVTGYYLAQRPGYRDADAGGQRRCTTAGIQRNGFGYLSYMLSDDAPLSLSLASTHRFQIPNNPGPGAELRLSRGERTIRRQLNENQSSRHVLRRRGAAGEPGRAHSTTRSRLQPLFDSSCSHPTPSAT